MKDAKIIITGGAGFIGSNLTRELTKISNNIIVIDDLSTGNYHNIKNLIETKKIKFYKESITNLKFLKKTFKDIDYVFHQAAIPSVPRSIKDPIKTNNANINGTLNVLIAAKENNVKKVVYASSSSAYGNTPKLPKKESMNTNPLSPYAVSKLTGEQYCKAFTEVFDLPTVSLRYFNVYGPRQNPENQYAAVIPKFILSVLNGKKPVIYGDGKQTRDFTFVKDVVNANILSAKSNVSDFFNVGSGNNITINKLAELIMNLLNKKTGVSHIDPVPGDVRDSLADISKANKKIGYKPKYNLEKGLKETIKWIQK